MNILGISCYYHDSAAALLRDGEFIAAAQEERFTRIKHDPDFPTHAIAYCLKQGGIEGKDLDQVGFYDKPFLKFERIMLTYLQTFPRSMRAFLEALPQWLETKLWAPALIKKELGFKGRIIFADHHMSHAASAFLVSPFDEAAIVTIDGVGEWSTATVGAGCGNDIKLFREIRFPHSLGLLYSAFTYYLGFKVNSAEYKVMGLAPYGEPNYADLIKKELIDIRDDGSFRMNMKYFAYHYGLTMTNSRFDKLFGGPRRDPEAKLDQRHKDIAASIQRVTEEIVLKMAQTVQKETGLKKLCMAGGVALNCVANGRVLRELPYDDIFVQPAAGDAGGAVGIAAFIYHTLLRKPRDKPWKDAFLGPEWTTEEIRAYLDENKIPYRELERKELLEATAKLIAEQNVVGWFQGRMEFGPRALGSRSILADARNPENKDRVNLKIKFRESFRPFAPTVLEEKVGEWFELDRPSPYMLLVAQVRKDKRVIPSVTHLDGSARIQTINRNEHPIYYDLVREFERQTGCPVIINTSFNVRGEPVVCTPEDAFRCFMGTEIEALAIGNCYLEKQQQDGSLKRGYAARFEPD